MVETYCTVEEVASRCNFLGAASSSKRAVFGTDPKIPSREEVVDLINIAEEGINDHCETAWGTLFLPITDELLTLHYDHWEVSIHLSHTNVKTFETGEGDKLEIWDGSSWVDWITEKTEGRGSDFFVDYEMGKVYLNKTFFRTKETRNVRATYRVNSGATVPKTVSIACSLLAGISILDTEYATVAFPEGEGEETSVDEMIRRWNKRVHTNLKRYYKRGLNTGVPYQPVY